VQKFASYKFLQICKLQIFAHFLGCKFASYITCTLLETCWVKMAYRSHRISLLQKIRLLSERRSRYCWFV